MSKRDNKLTADLARQRDDYEEALKKIMNGLGEPSYNDYVNGQFIRNAYQTAKQVLIKYKAEEE